MNKLRTICATLILLLAFEATGYALDGIMGTGIDSNDTPRGVVHDGGTDDPDKLLVEIELIVLENIIALF
ncbi:MAG TPA: hypothetical protein VF525_02920 [Pyrinomonadaceae bacterium]|jgi:hypothetical protein